jgi:hypothetical protein
LRPGREYTKRTISLRAYSSDRHLRRQAIPNADSKGFQSVAILPQNRSPPEIRDSYRFVSFMFIGAGVKVDASSTTRPLAVQLPMVVAPLQFSGIRVAKRLLRSLGHFLQRSWDRLSHWYQAK